MSSIVTLPTQRKIEQADPVGALPFVFTPHSGGRDFWRVATTGSYAQDCNVGKVFAREMLEYMEADVLGPSILVWVVREMIKKGPPDAGNDGLVVGFISAIGDAAIGSVVARPSAATSCR